MSDTPKKRGPRPDPGSKRSRKEDRHTGVRLVLYIPAELAAELDGMVESTVPQTTKAAVVRLALDRFFADRRKGKKL